LDKLYTLRLWIKLREDPIAAIPSMQS
jgi:hypothetical protein